MLNDQIVGARGEDIELDIRGVEQLRTHTDSIAPEAACTSLQFHLQVAPDSFADYWNASQAIAGVQVAVGANSPFLYGRQLWAETRIALFQQATDTRPDELKAQGVRPRVWFGERWITSIFDLFEENVRYFPPLLPICEDEDPVEVLHAGGVPQLGELRLHNGTVYRWNRPVYDIMNGRPHLRVENRVLPAGPTVVDMLANAAFYFGLVRGLAEADRPIWSQLTFSSAEENFHAAARRGLDAVLHWPGLGDVPVTKLVLDAAAAHRRRPAWTGSVSPRRSGTGCSASSSSAAVPAATAPSGRPRRSGRRSGATAWTGRTRCTTWSSATPNSSAPTSPSTPGQPPDPHPAPSPTRVDHEVVATTRRARWQQLHGQQGGAGSVGGGAGGAAGCAGAPAGGGQDPLPLLLRWTTGRIRRGPGPYAGREPAVRRWRRPAASPSGASAVGRRPSCAALRFRPSRAEVRGASRRRPCGRRPGTGAGLARRPGSGRHRTELGRSGPACSAGRFRSLRSPRRAASTEPPIPAITAYGAISWVDSCAGPSVDQCGSVVR